ncbi:preprotein translocase subunit SecE [Fontisphaera persica]|jgi:preprotein translocase subunit SecE|uniref:preprotein translocase subunit SecE n=1 Tax=Fontisphaera persica TaxID=2974023 RepID=UPI0024C087F9|nr:preprotein translocase subunit SecE [Fontisphaera persica]WCJ59550.1 preprotein translocase subunit SecE [Fontisphaera persica]
MDTGEILKILGLAALAAVVFYLWRKGHFLRLNRYIQETREELRKCTWPGREELKGSTVVVIVSVALLSAFTIVVDVVLHLLVNLVTTV